MSLGVILQLWLPAWMQAPKVQQPHADVRFCPHFRLFVNSVTWLVFCFEKSLDFHSCYIWIGCWMTAMFSAIEQNPDLRTKTCNSGSIMALLRKVMCVLCVCLCVCVFNYMNAEINDIFKYLYYTHPWIHPQLSHIIFIVCQCLHTWFG